MSEDALRRELVEARKEIKEADAVILEWKIALGNIFRAARKDDVEKIKQLVIKAL